MGWVQNASPEVNDQSKWPEILAVCVSLTALTTCAVASRVYVRVKMVKYLGIDDYIIVASCICSIIYSALCITQSTLGLGLPIALRPTANIDKYSEVNYAGRPFYMLGLLGFKCSLCFAYLRITANINSTYRIVIWLFMSFTILAHVAGILVLLFQCTPVKKSWAPRTPGKCLPNVGTFYALAAISIFCDVVIFFLPVPLLARIKINIRRKIGLIAIFLLGLFTTVCSTMRMVQINVIGRTGNSTMLVLWGTIELNVGIFLTCLPSLTPLFTYFANKSRATHYALYSRKKSGTNDTSNSAQPAPESKPAHMSLISTGRSDSQERIFMSTGDDLTILKTTEVDVQQFDSNTSVAGQKGGEW